MTNLRDLVSSFYLLFCYFTFLIPRHNLHTRWPGVLGVDENEVDFSFRSAPLFGSLRPRLTNDYSMSNYKQGVLFTRSMAANESGCAFNGLTPPTPEILSDGNHELWTKPVSTMRIHLWVLYLLLHISQHYLSSSTNSVTRLLLLLKIGQAPLTWFR